MIVVRKMQTAARRRAPLRALRQVSADGPGGPVGGQHRAAVTDEPGRCSWFLSSDSLEITLLVWNRVVVLVGDDDVHPTKLMPV
jgi:hypothetical protein